MRKPLASTVVLIASAAVPGLRTRSTAAAVAAAAALASQSNKAQQQTRSSYYAPHLKAKIANSIAKGERRANERSADLRRVCDGCSRPPTLCLCDSLPPSPISTRTRVLVLQHPNEFRKRNFSTVPLLKLVLENVRVKVGYSFDVDALDLKRGETPLLLFPGPDAIELDPSRQPTRANAAGKEPASNVANGSATTTNLLVLIDGTWAEARRMVRESPALLERCRRVKFASPDLSPSVYHAVRKEPEEHCLSTLEACARALDILEGGRPVGGGGGGSSISSSASERLRAVLRRHVDAHLTNALAAAPRHNADTSRLFKKNRRRREIERSLFEGEGGDGSYGSSSTTSRDAMTQFARVRLDDGATIRPLRSSDAPLVDSWWEHRSTASLTMVARCINADGGIGACLGVEGADGELRACIVRYEGGAVGMLYVEESYRRRGYGAALLGEATRALKERDEECVAFILDGNEASEALFAREGWKREDPTLKKGTGKRRANRKWVKK